MAVTKSYSFRRWPEGELFQITDQPIEQACRPSDSAGAEVVFTGLVRNHNQGRSVEALEYEAFDELAVKEGEQILREASGRFDIEAVRCVHRVGKLQIGDVAVLVACSSAHRQAAFDACRYVIDEVKCRVPIWKREVYADGESKWLNAAAEHEKGRDFSPEELELYDRQMRVPEIGLDGQIALKQSCVLVVGAGGLGCPALQYLAAAGVGMIGVCDFDVVDLTNLHRQPLFNRRDVGRPKAHVAAERLRALNPGIAVQVHDLRFDSKIGEELFARYDVVIDGADSFETKFQLNDVAVKTGTALVQASIYQRDGQIHVYDPTSGGGCLRCLWPEVPAEGCVGTCAEVGVLGAVPGMFGVMQAWEAIRLCLGRPSPLADHILFCDLETCEHRLVKRQSDPECPVCGSGDHSDERESPSVFLEDPSDIDTRTLVDIRELDEQREEPIEEFPYISAPLSSFTDDVLEQCSARPLLICARGVLSVDLATRLQDSQPNVKALSGGLRSLKLLARKVPH